MTQADETHKPALVVRADAGTRMGTGHVMRCIALAQAWEEQGGEVCFFIAKEAFPRIREAGFAQVVLYAQPGSREDAEATVHLSGEFKRPWVAVDGYHLHHGYQEALKESGLKVLTVDDNGEGRDYCADIVVNPNLHAHEGLYARRKKRTRLFLGPEFAFLRREFRIAAQNRRAVREQACNVLVTLGGSDPDNATLLVLQALESLKRPGLHVKAAAGAGNPHWESLLQAAQGMERVEVLRDVKNMADIMEWADVAVSAAGSTCWEMAATGLPALLIVLAENQEGIAQALHETGAALNLGWAGEVSPEAAARALTLLLDDFDRRRAMSEAASALGAGPGAERIARVMLGEGARA